MTDKEALEEIKEEFNLFLKGCGLISEEQIKTRIEHNDDFRKVYEANMLAIKTLEEKEADRWIPVTERLPEEGNKAYLTTVDYGNGGIASCQRFFYNDEIGWNDDCVIAWKPLPKPYESEEK